MILADGPEIGTGKVEGVDRERFYEKRSFTAFRVEPLHVKVMERGHRVGEPPSLEAVRARAQAQIAALPDETKRLRNPDIHPVLLSPGLARTKEQLLGQKTPA